MNERAQKWLGSRRVYGVVLLAVVLAAPSLTAGLAADDFFQEATLRGGHEVPGLPQNRLDLFNFASGDPQRAQELFDYGAYPWAADPSLRLAFFRPLSALTHALDEACWPHCPLLMHAQSLLWFALTVLFAGLVYRRFLGATWVAGLAFWLYAVDDTHGPTVGWVANRNAIVALAFALPALLLHDRWRRQGSRASGAWAVLLVALGLCAGEAALAIVAYLFAYALHLDRAPRAARVASLLPYGVVVVVWRAVYAHLGYGTRSSSVYIDPASQPWAFLAALPTRFIALVQGQLAFPWSDFTVLYGFIAPWLLPVVLAFSAVTLALLAGVLAPLWRRDATARFFTTGFLLAVLPVCATFPADRVLGFVGIGALGLVAQLVGAATTPTQRRVALALLVYHAGLAPLGLALRSRSIVSAAVPMEISDATLPKDATLADKTLVVVNPPSDLFLAFFPFIRTIRHETVPARLRCLVSTTDDLTVTRLDERTLLLHPTQGLFANVSEQLTRDVHQPLTPGARVEVAGMTVTVPSLTPDGRPAEARFTFDRSLDDSSLVWMAWHKNGFVPFVVPPVGATVTLPGQPFFAAVLAAQRALQRKKDGAP